MAALGLGFIILLIFIGSIGLIVVGARILHGYRTKKNLFLTKYRFSIPRNVRLAAGVIFVALGCLLMFWVVWSGAEYFIMRSNL